MDFSQVVNKIGQGDFMAWTSALEIVQAIYYMFVALYCGFGFKYTRPKIIQNYKSWP